jgi:hypothetical protein
MRALLDVVRLTRDLPHEGLRRDDVGTVVEVFRAPEEAYEVEFTDEFGRTTALVTLLPADIEPLPAPVQKSKVAGVVGRDVPAASATAEA